MKSPISGGYRSALLASATLCAITTAAAQTNGTWTGVFSGGNWSDTANWNASAVADGSGATADFSTVDLPLGPFSVVLDSARTIGTLKFGDSETFDTPGTWTLDGANALTLAGAPLLDISVTTTVAAGVGFEGSEGFTKQGTGDLILNANNSAGLVGAAGSFVLKEGLVRLGGGQANLQNAIGDSQGTVVFEGGRLALNGNLGDNVSGFGTFANPIVVADGQTGTLHQSTRATVSSPLTGNGTLNVAVPFVRGDFSGNWSAFTGTINLVKDPSSAAIGEFRLAGFQNQFFNNAKVHIGDNVLLFQVFNPPSGTGTQTIQAIGELSGSELGRLGGNPVNGRFVNWQIGALNTDSEFAGVIQNGTGAARLTKVGTGTLTLSGNNTHTGETAVNAGTLAIGNGGASGSLGGTNVTVAAGATIVFNRDETEASSYPGVLSGDGTVIKRGSGRVSFTGANTYTASTTIEGGTLAIAGDSGLGAPGGAVHFTGGPSSLASSAPGVTTNRDITIASGVQGGLSTLASGDSIEAAGTISGEGALGISGPGLVGLTAANTYSGGTVQNSGTLVVSNASGSGTGTGTVALNAGTLGGTGTIGGAVTVASGANVKAGPLSSSASGVGILTAGSLALSGGSTLHIEFAGTSDHDRIVVTGSNGLTTPGASTGNPVMVDLRGANSPAKFATPGTYNIIQFAGSFSGNANDLFEVTPASAQSGQTYTFGVSGGFITLTISGVAPSGWQVDGDGLWSVAGNWLNGVPDGPGITASLGPAITAPRTITLDSARTVGSLVFDSPHAYTIAGTATLTLNGGASGSVVTNIDGSHIVGTPVNLSTDLELVFNQAGDSLSFGNNVSGNGGISKSGPGSITLAGTNGFTGGLAFSGGSLSFADGGLGGGAVTLDGASLVWLPGNTQDVSALPLTFGDNPVTFDTNGNNVILAGDFGGLGEAPLTKDGEGVLTLAADTGFVGDITIAAGTLRLGNGGGTGSVTGDIVNNGELVVARSDDAFIPNLISGTGSLVHSGPGNLLLSAANTFGGTTMIASGAVELLNPLALQNSTLIYDNGGGSIDPGDFTAITLGGLDGDKDLALETTGETPLPIALTVGGNNDNTVYSGILSGPGSLTKVGTGTMVLGGAHTYSGATTTNGGVLELAAGSSIDTTSANVGTGGLLLVNGGSLSSSVQTVNLGGGANGILIQDGSAAFNGGILSSQNDGSLVHVAGGALTATDITLRRTLSYGNGNDPNPATAGLNGFVVSGGTAALSGSLLIGTINSSASALVDGGDLDVAGPIRIGNTTNNRWSMLEVRSGTLDSSDAAEGVVLSPHPTTANKSLFLVSGGTAKVERISFGATGGAAGTGRVTMNAGELYIGAGGMEQVPGEFDSQVRLLGGTLGATASWSTNLTIETGGIFAIKTAGPDGTPFDITLDGFVTGTGSLEKTGDGTLRLAGGAFYTGYTYVEAGTLRMDFPDFDDDSSVEVASGATLDLPHGQNDVVREFRINGETKLPGIYGAPGSTGDVIGTPGITGTGRIVVSDGDAFDAWIDSFTSLTVEADKAKDADPDGDGLTNIEEFGLDGDPTSGAASGKVRVRIENVGGAQALVVTLPVRKDAAFSGSPAKTATIDGVVYTIRGGNDLTAFDQEVGEVVPASAADLPALSDPDGWEYRTFRLSGAIGGATPRGPKGFLDIEIDGEGL